MCIDISLIAVQPIVVFRNSPVENVEKISGKSTCSNEIFYLLYLGRGVMKLG